MAKKQFKTESKKLLDMMINSIYTHKEIFLRELISNASDALDKLYFRSLTDDTVTLSREDYAITLSVNEKERTLTIADNGCGMTLAELENNLGTIAKSGSFDFKRERGDATESEQSVDIIGQFGVGFYSAFMVADKITVESRAYGADEAYRWQSSGADGYTVEPCDKTDAGTIITLLLKADTEDEKYGEFLSEYKLRALIRKYSDYIRYPIKMEVTTSRLKEGSEDEYESVKELQTLNSMVPLWKKSPSEVSREEYDGFYRDKFFDFEAPAKVIHVRAEGLTSYEALMYIPSHAPYNYYTTDYKRGLQLYSSGVMIMEHCEDLVPDYFGFVKGLVDSADLSLNISREMLQHDRQLKAMAKAIEKRIRTELEKMLQSDREAYEKFFDAFGLQLKYGLYADYGAHKDELRDLVLFRSGAERKLVSLKEYTDRMKADQKAIYYACGETADRIAMLPQVSAVEAHGFKVLYLTDDIDEFALKMLGEYQGKSFANVCTEQLDITSDEQKEQIKKQNEDAGELLSFMKDTLGDAVVAVRLVGTLKEHPVSLSTEGEITLEMEKVLNKMPGADIGKTKASLVLEINAEHAIAKRLQELFVTDREQVGNYTKILYAQARLISGLNVDNPSELSELICGLMY